MTAVTTAQRRVLLNVYGRLQAGQVRTTLSVTSGGNARTLDALQRRGLITWVLESSGWRKLVTLTPEGLTWCAGATRYCPRCSGGLFAGEQGRGTRLPVTVGYEPRGTRNIGDPIKAPCPCRWHDDEELIEP